MNNLMTLKQARPEVQQRFMTGVYLRMAIALLITAAVAFFTATSETMLRFLFRNSTYLFLMIGELALVFYLSARIRKLSVPAASLCFLGYAVLNGLTLSSIFIVYTSSSIFHVFVIAAVMFGGMVVYGMKTKSDFRSAGRYLYMALFGLIIASVVNLLLKSDGISWFVSIVGVVIFVGLTAYDTQKLMSIAVYDNGSEDFQKVAIIGALELYLDFINIFLKLLQLFGKRR